MADEDHKLDVAYLRRIVPELSEDEASEEVVRLSRDSLRRLDQLSSISDAQLHNIGISLGVRSALLRQATSSADSLLGPAAAAVLLYRKDAPGANGILVRLEGSDSVEHYYVFSAAHCVVGRYKNETVEVEHRNSRLLVLKPGEHFLVANNPDTFIELTWTSCIHWARLFWGTAKAVTRFSSDCAVFGLRGDLLSDVVRARAVPVFDWQGGNHRPSIKAVGVSLVRDAADLSEPKFIEVRIEERVSAWAGAYVYLPSEASAEGQSGTGLTDKKSRLVSVVSGKYAVGQKQCAVAVLVKRHLQLLNEQSGADSFVPAAESLTTLLNSAPSSSSSSAGSSSTTISTISSSSNSSVPAATSSSSSGTQ